MALGVSLTILAAGAETITVSVDGTYEQDIVAEDDTISIDNSGTIINNKIVLKGGAFKNSGIVDTGSLWLETSSSEFGGTVIADELTVFGKNYKTFNGDKIESRLLSIISTDEVRSGLRVTKSSQLAGVGEVYIESNGQRSGLFLDHGAEDGASYNGTVVLNTVSGTQEARIEAEGAKNSQSDAYYYVDRVISYTDGSTAKNKLQTSNHGTHDVVFEIGDIHIESGYMNIQTESNTAAGEEQKGTFILNTVTLEEGANFRASVYGEFIENTKEFKLKTPPMLIEGKDGNITFNLASGAVVDFGGYNIADNTNWAPEHITIAADSITVNIEDSNGSNLVYLSKPGLKTEAGNIRVVAASSNNTGNAFADLDKLAGIVQTNYKDGEDRINRPECLPGVVLVQQANDLYDAAQGVVVGETDESGDCVNCSVSNITQTANPNINGIAEMTALGLHIWRNEIDDMHRRLGELRDSSAQSNGIWTRVYNGRASFGGQNIENKYTAFQFGYDRQAQPGLWVGGAMSYTYGDNSFNHGGGDSSLLAFTGYASRLYDNGLYLDFTGKVGRMKNSFDISVSDIRSSGDYHTNAVSISAEAGWRFSPVENVFVEPQLELWYGHVFDAQYQTSTGVEVDQASTDSLVGRAGVRFGISCPNNRGSAFLKASVLHDWKGEADFRFGKPNMGTRTLSEDLGGTWYEYGIGADFNMTDQLHFWAELERGDGGEVDTDYRATIGMRYAW